MPGTITVVLRHDDTSQPLADRTFELWQSESGILIGTAQTDSEGVAVFFDVPPDTSSSEAYCVIPVDYPGWDYFPEQACTSVAPGQEVTLEFTSYELTM
jgi:hypothetical protein